ncbi:hypothetical protein C7120_06105 [Prevotella sp. oral taxon 376]|nr:hypothetical protein C7120_06105 [Prevotella sp. oral taxon 376]
MRYFNSRRPQGFHHGFIYSDGKEKAEDLRDKFSESLLKGREKRRVFSSRWVNIVFPLILVLLLIFVCYIMI